LYYRSLILFFFYLKNDPTFLFGRFGSHNFFSDVSYALFVNIDTMRTGFNVLTVAHAFPLAKQPENCKRLAFFYFLVTTHD